MATVRDTREGRSQTRADIEAAREPQLFRFGLKHLFLFVSAAVLLLGTMAWIRGGWALGLAFLAALLVAHVSATFVGKRLRDSTIEVERWRGGRPGVEAEPRRRDGS